MFQPGQKKKTTSTPSIVLFNPSHDVSIQLYTFNNNNKSEADELDKLSTHRQSSDSSTSHSIFYMTFMHFSNLITYWRKLLFSRILYRPLVVLSIKQYCNKLFLFDFNTHMVAMWAGSIYGGRAQPVEDREGTSRLQFPSGAEEVQFIVTIGKYD